MRALACLALACAWAGCMGPGDAPAADGSPWADHAAQIARGVRIEECASENLQVRRVDEPVENQTPPQHVTVNLTSFIGDGKYLMASFPLYLDGCVGVAGLARAQHEATTGLIYTARSQTAACWWSGGGSTQHATTGVIEITLKHTCVHHDFGTDRPWGPSPRSR